jgi:tetratricopeptide (TPR) repeat protein
MSDVAQTATPRDVPSPSTPAGDWLSTEELNVLHNMAYSFYVRGAYDDAIRYFWFLSMHAPREKRYLKSLSASLFMAKRFAEAAVVYALLLHIAPLDSEVLYMSGHTLLMQGKMRDAQTCLELATALSRGKSEFSARAAALLELIKKQ